MGRETNRWFEEQIGEGEEEWGNKRKAERNLKERNPKAKGIRMARI